MKSIIRRSQDESHFSSVYSRLSSISAGLRSDQSKFETLMGWCNAGEGSFDAFPLFLKSGCYFVELQVDIDVGVLPAFWILCRYSRVPFRFMGSVQSHNTHMHTEGFTLVFPDPHLCLSMHTLCSVSYTCK